MPVPLAQVLRRAQFALKNADADEAMEGGEDEGEPKPKAKAKGRPKARGKAKAKAKSKALPKAKGRQLDASPCTPSKRSKTSKSTSMGDATSHDGLAKDDAPSGDDAPVCEEGGKASDGLGDTDLPHDAKSEPAPPADPAAPKTKTRKRAPKTKKVEDSAGNEAGNGGGEAQTGKRQRVRYAEPQSFARRPKPSGTIPLAKWTAMRSAFNRIIKPKVRYHSPHEDGICTCGFYVWSGQGLLKVSLLSKNILSLAMFIRFDGCCSMAKV